MAINYLLADVITRIRNAIMRKYKHVIVPKSGLVIHVLTVLHNNGYLTSFDILDRDVKVYLKYYNGESVINYLKIHSKPGRRQYIKSDLILQGVRPKNLYGLWILSTNYGVISHVDAFNNNTGGELLLEVH